MADKIQVKRYNVQHSVDEYTFPTEALIHDVTFDDKYMHVELTDQRMISIPLWWIPTIYNAAEEDRKKFEINQSRTMIIWDPDKSGINDEITIADYLESKKAMSEYTMPDYLQKKLEKQIAEEKPKKK